MPDGDTAPCFRWSYGGLFWFFFFSSRRRHTRWPRDWSSDVCSSDLGNVKNFTQRIINNSGTATWSAGSFQVGSGGTFNNNGTFTNTYDGNYIFNLGGTARSEERRVGKEGRERWRRQHSKEK